MQGERAIDAYMREIEREREMEEEMWDKAMEDELYKTDPILFVKMFGARAYKSVIDDKDLKVEVSDINKEEMGTSEDGDIEEDNELKTEAEDKEDKEECIELPF